MYEVTLSVVGFSDFAASWYIAVPFHNNSYSLSLSGFEELLICGRSIICFCIFQAFSGDHHLSAAVVVVSEIP